MSRPHYEVRPFSEADFAGMARIIAEHDPEHPSTIAELQHWDHLLNIEPERLNLKVTVKSSETGEMVGWGSLAQPSFNFTPGWYWIWVAIALNHLGRGAGSLLFTHLEGEARMRHAVGLWANTREHDVRGVRFFQHRGFKPLRKSWQSRLDVAHFDLSSVPDRSKALVGEGIRFTTLAQEGPASPAVRRSLYALIQLSDADIPRLGRHHPISFEEFVALDLEGPRSMPEAVFLALHGSKTVGVTSLQRQLARPDTLHVGFTGVHPEYRNRRIATELKRQAVLFARERGIHFLVTGNDSMNRPIVSINHRLGFRPETVWIQGERLLMSSRPNEPDH